MIFKITNDFTIGEPKSVISMQKIVIAMEILFCRTSFNVTVLEWEIVLNWPRRRPVRPKDESL